MAAQLRDDQPVERGEAQYWENVWRHHPTDRIPVVELPDDLRRQRFLDRAASVYKTDQMDARESGHDARRVPQDDRDLDAVRRQRLVLYRVADRHEAIGGDEDEVPYGQQNRDPEEELTVPEEAYCVVDNALTQVPHGCLHEDAASDDADPGVHQSLVFQKEGGQAGEVTTVDGQSHEGQRVGDDADARQG